MASYTIADCRRKPMVKILRAFGIGGLRDIGRRFAKAGIVQRIQQYWS